MHTNQGEVGVNVGLDIDNSGGDADKDIDDGGDVHVDVQINVQADVYGNGRPVGLAGGEDRGHKASRAGQQVATAFPLGERGGHGHGSHGGNEGSSGESHGGGGGDGVGRGVGVVRGLLMSGVSGWNVERVTLQKD